MSWLNAVLFHTVFCFLVFVLTITASCEGHEESQTKNHSCPATSCSPSGPEIRFPFGIRGRKWCSEPGFEISCKGNLPVLLLPSTHEEVIVKDIDYTYQTLEVDYNGCFPGLLFHLNLSLSPFHYSCIHKRADYTFINCSTAVKEITRFTHIHIPKVDCMSNSKRSIFLLPSHASIDDVPASCQFMKNVKEGPALGGEGDRFVELKWAADNSNKVCFLPQLEGGAIASFFVLFAAVVGIIYYHFRKLEREKGIENQLEVEKFLKEYKSIKPTRYSYSSLKRMTDQFKEKVGQGAYGSVYKGKLDNGSPVAVKILHKVGEDAQEFVNEVATIGRIHHVNIVRLLGFCTENFKRALIYEFMPNESLEKFIFSTKSNSSSLSWEKVQDIAIGIARGIEYLHQGCEQRILHFDIKPHNILLDQNFIPKISDFGLAKFCSKGKTVVSMSAARGTMGYIAPEVLSRNLGNISYKSDVYSFGMLLLEMIGRRKNIDVTVENSSQVYFPEWIYNRLHHGRDLGPHVASNDHGDSRIVTKLATVALWCIQWYPVDRPSMKSVIQMLEGSIESLTEPPNPFVSSAPSNVETSTNEEIHDTKLEIIEELEEGKECDAR